MTYGIPESAGMAVEKLDKTQYWKCLECALAGIDNHITDVYQVNGTIYCLFHAQKEKSSTQLKESITYVTTPNGPVPGFHVSTD